MQTTLWPVTHFDLEKIANSGQVFRWERVGDHAYLLSAGSCAAIARQPDAGSLELTCPDRDIGFWRRYLALDDDYDRFFEIIGRWALADGQSAYLTRAVQAADGIRILHQEPFETVISFIVSQNNNIPRIKSILNALCRTLGPAIPGLEHLALSECPHAFPAPKSLCQPAALAAVRLGYRDRYVARAAADFAANPTLGGELLALGHGAARQRLLTLDGVGPKVADCILLFGLGCLDAFPRDVWINRILNREFPGEFPLARYAGFAGLLQQMIFFYERQEQGALHKP